MKFNVNLKKSVPIGLSHALKYLNLNYFFIQNSILLSEKIIRIFSGCNPLEMITKFLEPNFSKRLLTCLTLILKT